MVLFNGMSQTTPWAALYFVALMTFGNYVLFNLLVAILVEGFQESKEEEKRQLVKTQFDSSKHQNEVQHFSSCSLFGENAYDEVRRRFCRRQIKIEDIEF